jgi:hypothetical protein
MSSLINAGHQFVQSTRPVIENLRLTLLLCEINDSGWTIDFNFKRCVVDQLCEHFLGSEFIEIQEFSHSDDINAGVVIGDDADVLKVLNLFKLN